MSNNNIGVFGKMFRKNINAGFPEPGDNKSLDAALLDKVKQAVEVEKSKLETMSHAELIDYAANTRVHLNNVEGNLNEVIDALYTYIQLQLITIDTVNRVIKKQAVKPIDISMGDAVKAATGK